MRRPHKIIPQNVKHVPKMRRPHENNAQKRQKVPKMIKMWKFVKILIDALVAIFGIYGVDFPP